MSLKAAARFTAEASRPEKVAALARIERIEALLALPLSTVRCNVVV
jgi:hypothetical protein